MIFFIKYKFYIPYWQFVPVYPLAQVHVYPPRLLFVHAAPFRHGFANIHGSALNFGKII